MKQRWNSVTRRYSMFNHISTFSKRDIYIKHFLKELSNFLRSNFPLGVIWAISASSTSDLLYLRRSQHYCVGSIVLQQSTKNNPFNIPEITSIKKWLPNRTIHSCNSIDITNFPYCTVLLHNEIHHNKVELITEHRAVNTMEALVSGQLGDACRLRECFYKWPLQV